MFKSQRPSRNPLANTQTIQDEADLEQRCRALYEAQLTKFVHLDTLERCGDDDDDDDQESEPNTSAEHLGFFQYENQKNKYCSTNNYKNQEVEASIPGSLVDFKRMFNCENRAISPSKGSETHFSKYRDCGKLEFLASRLILKKAKHASFLKKFLEFLPNYLFSMDSSKAWILYWILHGLTLCSSWKQHDVSIYEMRIIALVSDFWDPTNGGYGGSSQEISHLASTYAAVCSIICVGTPKALSSINRTEIYKFIKSQRDPTTGGFTVHKDGECDVRGAYCAVAVAALLNIVDDDLFDGLDQYIASLQSYDGGLCGEPGGESHAGYSYCGLAALVILGKHEVLDLKNLLMWTLNRQQESTGGFNGRVNKLTDSCYNFWCGGIISLLKYAGLQTWDETFNFYDSNAVQMYTLACCQESIDDSFYTYKGGFRDKPGNPQDIYHTCYSLSGLSLAQNRGCLSSIVVGSDPLVNHVVSLDSRFNLSEKTVQNALSFFKSSSISVWAS